MNYERKGWLIDLVDTRTGEPPSVMRLRRRVYLVGITEVILGLLLVVATNGVCFGIFAVFVVGIALQLAVEAMLLRTLRKHCDAHSWLLCTRCEYPLDGLQANEENKLACPECGQSMKEEMIRMTWKRAIRRVGKSHTSRHAPP